MIIAIVPVVVLILGLLLYFASANPKAQEVGRIAFFVGLFWLVSLLLGRTVRL